MTLHRNARTCPEPRRLSAPQFRLDPPMQSSASLKNPVSRRRAGVAQAVRGIGSSGERNRAVWREIGRERTPAEARRCSCSTARLAG